MQTQATHAVSSNYINLHCTGIGYLGRVRTVKVRKGEDFYSRPRYVRCLVKKGVRTGFNSRPLMSRLFLSKLPLS